MNCGGVEPETRFGRYPFFTQQRTEIRDVSGEPIAKPATLAGLYFKPGKGGSWAGKVIEALQKIIKDKGLSIKQRRQK